MRLKEIEDCRLRYSSEIQPLPEGDFSDSVGKCFSLSTQDSLRQKVARAISYPLLSLLSQQARSLVPSESLPEVNHWAVEERFTNHASWAVLMRHLHGLKDVDVFVPGCYVAGEDVQFWLRRGVKSLSGIDIYSLDRQWSHITKALEHAYKIPVIFRQGSIENIPFSDKQFDVIVSDAVLEHVRNLRAMVSETFRILKPGGYALHMFGPLYFSFGADHCISAYGEEYGYDHLLLPEGEYRKRIAARNFFEKTAGNADLAFWAENDQFSFATASEYMLAFREKFEIVHSVAKISQRSLSFRVNHPEKWASLIDSGILEPDLMIKSLNLLVRRPLV
jgi:ubiquinone/menaquinone biosynthesis C-methylase UbiE